jgi:hypothetical protein
MRAWSPALSTLLALASLPAYAQVAPAPAPPPSAPPASPLSAGGLAPPPAVENARPPAAPGAVDPAAMEQDLARADREDSGRGLEFVWLNGEVGVMHLGLATFAQDHLVDSKDVKTTETGLVAGAGLGVRLVFLTFGARFRYAPLPDVKLWTLGAEAGIHAPFGALELNGALGLGYAAGTLAGSSTLVGLSSVGKIAGFDARLGGGLDYYFTNMFSAGVNLSADLLLLKRSAKCATGVGPAFDAHNATYCVDGSSTAGALSATAVFGLHF